jgi:hypothetical protein
MTDSMTSRREFLKGAALGTAGIALPAAKATCLGEEPAGNTAAGIRLGVASYSLRELSRADAIAAIVALRTRYVSIKSFHLPYESTGEELAAGSREFEDAGLTIVGGGVITLQQEDDADIRSHFE